MAKKTKAELRKIALKAVATRRKNDSGLEILNPTSVYKLNSKFNLPTGTISPFKIKKYLRDNKTSLFISVLLRNITHSIEYIAKKTGKDVAEVKRFLPNAIQSVIEGKPVIGKSTELHPGLKKWREDVNQPKNVGSGRKKGSKNKSTTFYEGLHKKNIHNAIIENCKDERTPKKGNIPTLPYHFALELQIITIAILKGLNFLAFEFPYNLQQGKKSAKTFRKQVKILKENDNLKNRVPFHAKVNISTYLKSVSASDLFPAIFLDLCGTFSSNKGTIKHILEYNQLMVGGICWITLSTFDLNGGGNTIAKLSRLIQSAGGDRYIFEKIEGRELYTYKGGEDGNGMPMVSVILRRVK